MPKLLFAHPPCDALEQHQIRKLANSRHAPADWIRRAQMIALSWQGLRTTAIASCLHWHPQTVREKFTRFNAEGLDGLGDLPGAGRKPRLTEQERSVIVALAASVPPGRLARRNVGTLVAENEDKVANWTLNALAQAAQERGIVIGRSQVGRILLKEGVSWRHAHSWAHSPDPEFVPKEMRSSPSTRTPRTERRPSV